MLKKGKYILIILLFCISAIYIISDVYALRTGQKIGSLKIKNTNDKDAWIPYIGKKVVVIFYADPDAFDLTDSIADALKAKNYPKDKFQFMFIANAKDTWMPNAAIRNIARKKGAKYKTTVLLDTNYTIKTKWGLGNCDDKSVVIVIGKDRKVKFVQKISSQGQARNIINEVVKAVE